MTRCIKSIVPLDFLFVVCWRGLVKLIKSIVPLDFLFVVCRRGLVKLILQVDELFLRELVTYG